MSTATVYELIGFAASLLIVISITQRSILRLRIIGLIGSITFTVYGGLIGAYPVMAVNFAATLIHLYYLVQLKRPGVERFTVLPISGDMAYLDAFCGHYLDDIDAIFPAFRQLRVEQPDWAQDLNLRAGFILRNVVPAGLFIGRDLGDGVIEVVVDYVIPEYRDLRAAQFLFDTDSGLFGPGDRILQATASTRDHRSYLHRVGFAPLDAEAQILRRPIGALRPSA